VIASSAHLFVYPPARRLASALGARIIFEVRDLWPLSLVEVAGVAPWHPIVKIMDRIERQGYRTADAVVSLLPHALDHMIERGLARERFHWIPNGVSAHDWDGPPAEIPAEHREAIARARREGKLVLVYAGAHGPPNALEQVVDLAGVAGETPPYQFLLVGDGVSKPILQERARAEKADFITFLPRVGKREARAIMQAADVCFIGWQDRPLYRFGVSANKLFEYLMAGKPVLHAISQRGDIVREAGAGLSVPAFDPVKLEEALRRLAGMKAAEREAMGARGRQHVLASYEWSVLGRRYYDICAGLLGERRAAEPVRGVASPA
jgi:glycosyltransferase involved in cell wall biosynthesis